MPRLFISHSSKDNIAALAFQRWLMGKGWGEDDVFIDLHDMQAGEKWRETLVKANVACDALLFLASPEALDSDECKREVRRAEDDRKDVIVAILRDVRLDDPRLKPWMDRQIMDLSAELREERVEVEHQSRRHFVDFNRLALEAIHAKLIDWGHAPDSFAWPPKERPNAQPYPGLDAFDELSAGIFFGREADIMSGIRDLRQMRHRGSPRLMVIQAASGAGKSSFLRAGLWPKLSRTAEFVPLAIVRPAKGVITGPQGLGKGLEDWFGRHRIRRSAGAINAELMAGDATAGAARLAGFMSEAAKLVTETRSLAAEDARPPTRPSMLIAIDQGEELFAAENAAESERFFAMLGNLLAHPPDSLDPYAVITIRADSVDPLLQRVPKLGIDAPHMRPLPPLSPSAYRDVITRPAAVYTRRVGRLEIEPELVEALVAKSTGKDALPLLAYTLQRMFYSHHKDHKLTLAHYEAMGGIEGSIDLALGAAKAKAGTVGSDDHLLRLMVPGLATWDPAAGGAKRIVADEAELLSGDRAVLAPLANALVDQDVRLLTRGAGTIEVAHEALLRRPLIAGWLDRRKDDLKLRDDILKEAEDWANGGRHVESLVRRGARLEAALTLQADKDFASTLAPAKDYLAASRALETAGQRRDSRRRTAIYTLMLGVIGALTAVIYKEPLLALAHEITTVRPYIAASVTPHLLTEEHERALKAGNRFRECEKLCPEMIAIPAGTFVMGSPDGKTPVIGLDGKSKDGQLAPAEKGREPDEGPQREVAVAAFAAGKHEVTFDDYMECVRLKGCVLVSDSGYGTGRKPVINISWDEAKRYVEWLARMTGKPYRLLTEAEWEYAARAGATTTYSFGSDERDLCDHANFADLTLRKVVPAGWVTSDACEDKQTVTAIVGSYSANAFGLFDMHGNVQEWTEDCYMNNYDGAPTDGSARQTTDCKQRVARGGSWSSGPQNLRAAYRGWNSPDLRYNYVGFRVGRSLLPPRTL